MEIGDTVRHIHTMKTGTITGIETNRAKLVTVQFEDGSTLRLPSDMWVPFDLLTPVQSSTVKRHFVSDDVYWNVWGPKKVGLK